MVQTPTLLRQTGSWRAAMIRRNRIPIDFHLSSDRLDMPSWAGDQDFIVGKAPGSG